MPRGLGSPLGVAVPGALRFTPLFLGPSAGGPMAAACAAGVPGAGVLGVESEAFSLEFGAAGSVFEVAGDSLLSLTGDSSSLTDSGSTMRRSFSGDSFKVTMRLSLSLADAAGVDEAAVDEAGVTGVDFRRSLSLDAGVAVVLLLLDAAMTTDDGKGGKGKFAKVAGELVVDVKGLRDGFGLDRFPDDDKIGLLWWSLVRDATTVTATREMGWKEEGCGRKGWCWMMLDGVASLISLVGA